MQISRRGFHLIALAAAALPYCATPWFGFVFDDRKQVLGNPGLLHLQSIAKYFVHAGGYLAGEFSYYRPLFGAWMNLNYAAFGFHPAGWHLALLALHVLVVYLCYRVAQEIVHDRATAVLAALLFAVHPVHVESVAWISGGTDPLAAIFVLTAFLLHYSARSRRGRTVLAWLSFFASLLCKETALLFPALIFFYELLLSGTGAARTRVLAAVRQSAPYIAIAAAYLALRIYVLGAFSHTLTPLSFRDIVLTSPSVAVFYVRLLFFPSRLSPFYDTPYVKTPSVHGFILPVIVLLALAGLLAWWIRRMYSPDVKIEGENRARGAIFLALWTVIFLVPAFNFPALDPGEIAHDRYLYLPSFGFCALAAMALMQAGKHLRVARPISAAAVAALVLALGSATIAQSMFWKDDLALYERGAAIAPNNVDAQNNVANMYLERGDFARGIEAHQKILRLNPRFVRSYFNLGVAYYNLGDFRQAQSYLQRAIDLQPDAEGYFYLGISKLKQGDPAGSEQALQTAVRLDVSQSKYHAALGVAYEIQGKLPSATQELEQALSLNPQNEGVRKELARIRARVTQAP